MPTEFKAFSSRVLILVGSFGPLGHLPASGTVTVALIGVPLFAWMSTSSPAAYTVITVALIAAAVFVHDRGDRILGQKDSPILVWDEIAGFLVGVAFLPFTWPLALVALLVERCVDIAKVQPARWVEKHVAGGWGVVGDDVIAGLYTRVLMELALFVFPGLRGP